MIINHVSTEDPIRSATHFGNTISHVDGIHYKLVINNDQIDSYLECNKVKDVELLNPEEAVGTLITSCSDCGSQVIPLVETQIRELLKTKFNEQIRNKLFWDVNQLVYSHHFDSPISIDD